MSKYLYYYQQFLKEETIKWTYLDHQQIFSHFPHSPREYLGMKD